MEMWSPNRLGGKHPALRLGLRERVDWLKQCLCLALALSFLGALNSDAGDRRILFTNLEVSDGIGGGEIRSIIRDSRGFMWFATQSGLNRYDGHEIREYRHSGSDPNTPSADDITVIYEDRQKWIWVGTKSQGLNRYDPANESFLRIPRMGSQFGELEVTSILQSSNEVLWFGTRGGLFLMEKGSLTPVPIGLAVEEDDESEANIQVMVETIFEDKSGILWVGTRSRGLCCFDPEVGVLRSVWNGGVGVVSIAEENDGILWVGTLGEGIVRVDSKNLKFLGALDAKGLPSPHVGPIFRDSYETMWVGMRAGLCRYDSVSREFQLYAHEPGNPGSPVRGGIKSIFEAKNKKGEEKKKKKILWLGGASGGVSRFSLDGYWFDHLRHRPNDNSTISAEGVWSFLENQDGSIWIGTDSGLDLYDPDSREVLESYSTQNSGTVSALVRGKNGEIFAGTKGEGVQIFDTESGEFREIDVALYDGATEDALGMGIIQKGTVSNMLLDRRGGLWIGTEGGGLYLLAADGANFERVLLSEREEAGLKFITAIEEDSLGAVWIGTMGSGLYRMNPETRKVMPFPSWAALRGVRSVLSSKNITSLKSAGKSLWVGTSHHGVNRIDLDTGITQKYEVAPGKLPHGKVFGILEDRSGLLWVSTGSGLARIDPATDSFRNFDVHDGLQADVFHPHSGLTTVEGKLYFGGPNGFNIVDPSILPKVLTPQLPMLTGLELFGERVKPSKDGVLKRELALTNVLELPYDKAKRIALTFATLSFATPHRSQFRFRLKGLEEGWTTVEEERKATYTGLEPGEYVFQVQTKLRDQAWTTNNIVSLPIKVLPPWFQTWWARAGIALGGLAIIALVIVVIVRSNLQRLRRRENELNVARSKAEAALSRQLQNAMLLEQTTDHIRHHLDGGALFHGALEQLCDHLEIDGCRLLHFVQDSQLKLLAEYGDGEVSKNPEESDAMEEEFPLNDPLVRSVLERDKAATIADIAEGSCGAILSSQLKALGAESAAVVRTSYMGEANGLIVLFHDSTREWKEDEVKLLEAIAAQVGIAIAQVEMAAKEDRHREDLEEARQVADDANNAKSEFLAKMTHELRTPLNAILGFSRLLGEDKDTTPRQLKIINIVNSSGEHLLDIINDVLEMSKIESGKMELNEAPFDLCEMLDSVENMLGHKARSQGLRFAVVRENELPSVIEGDRGKLRQCLVNLLGNAIKFTDEGCVSLRVRAERIQAGTRISQNGGPVSTPGLRHGGDTRLHFVVKDSGKGIDEAEIPNLFQKFVQTDSGRKSHQGTGLGLAITAYFVEMMGGEIEVESEPGKGSEFRFSIACSTADSSPMPAGIANARRVVGLAPGQDPIRVLVAEDQMVNRMLLTKILRTTGFEIEEAENGAIAVAKWKSWNPHLIFMDQDMPIMKGSEATQAIIEQAGQSSRPVIIALTAYALDEARASAMEAGCDDFLSKPFDKDELFEVIAKHISVNYVYEEQKPMGETALPA